MNNYLILGDDFVSLIYFLHTGGRRHTSGTLFPRSAQGRSHGAKPSRSWW
jgi:hypothetical protein